MKNKHKGSIKKYFTFVKYMFFPPRKKYILSYKMKKHNAGGFSLCKLEINNSKKIKEKVKYYSRPNKLYKSMRSTISETNFIYMSRNQKGFNSYYFKKEFDIMLTDHRGRVLELIPRYKIDQISDHYKSAYYIYFMPVGMITYYSIKKNDLAIFKTIFTTNI